MTMLFSHRGRWGLLALVALLGVCATARPVGAQAKTSADMVSVKAKAEKPTPDGKQVILVTLTPQKGWHIYANPVGNMDLEDTQTVVSVVGKEAKVDYPAGKPAKDGAVGSYKIYDEPVTIKAVITRGKDTSPLQVNVKIQACSDRGKCLLPVTVKAAVE